MFCFSLLNQFFGGTTELLDSIFELNFVFATVPFTLDQQFDQVVFVLVRGFNTVGTFFKTHAQPSSAFELLVVMQKDVVHGFSRDAKLHIVALDLDVVGSFWKGIITQIQ